MTRGQGAGQRSKGHRLVPTALRSRNFKSKLEMKEGDGPIRNTEQTPHIYVQVEDKTDQSITDEGDLDRKENLTIRIVILPRLCDSFSFLPASSSFFFSPLSLSLSLSLSLGSALLTAAHSEGQTQIPDTWRLEKEREESQPKRNGQNQQPDDEAATADSRT